jgi:hypothetical protein
MNGFYDLTPCPNKCSRFIVDILPLSLARAGMVLRGKTIIATCILTTVTEMRLKMSMSTGAVLRGS